MSDFTDKLNQAVQMTEAMLVASEQADWDTLCELELTRRKTIAAMFAEPLLMTHAEQEQVKKVIELDKAIIALAETGRAGLGERIRSFDKGRQVSKQYQDTASFGRYS